MVGIGRIITIDGSPDTWFRTHELSEVKTKQGSVGTANKMYMTRLGSLILYKAEAGDYKHIRPTLAQVGEWFSANGYDELPFSIKEIEAGEI